MAGGSGPRALVLTVSDGVSAGTREDAERRGAGRASGASSASTVDALACRRTSRTRSRRRCSRAAAGHALIVISTGGTGPRRRATSRRRRCAHCSDYEIPGFGEQMRAFGRAQTPLADLSRSLAGVLGSTLVIAVPGSPRRRDSSRSRRSEPLLDHALETLGGQTQHTATDAAPR